MRLTNEQLNKFKEIYRSQIGQDIDDTSALILAEKLLELVRITYQPISKPGVDPRQLRIHFEEEEQ